MDASLDPCLHPSHSLYVPHASFAYCIDTFKTHFTISHHQVSPSLMVQNLGCLSIPIKNMETSAQYASHEGRSFTIHSANSTTFFLISPLASTKRSSQCCRLIELLPPVPAPPKRCRATSITVSYFSYTGTSSGCQPV